MTETRTRAERRAATAGRILRAAQEEFGDRGMEGATIRGIARRAGVDPSLVMQHYGSKQALFSLAVRPDPALAASEVPRHLVEVLTIRLRELPPETRVLLRSMLTSAEAGAVMRDYLQERVADLARASDRDDAEVRATVLVSSILGLTLARHFLHLPALQDLDDTTIDTLVQPWFAAMAGGDAGGVSGAPG